MTWTKLPPAVPSKLPSRNAGAAEGPVREVRPEGGWPTIVNTYDCPGDSGDAGVTVMIRLTSS